MDNWKGAIAALGIMLFNSSVTPPCGIAPPCNTAQTEEFKPLLTPLELVLWISKSSLEQGMFTHKTQEVQLISREMQQQWGKKNLSKRD